jgi:prepilin-type N-terminal cleavage/methylation domain-containing protein
MRRSNLTPDHEHGMSLVELMIALVVLSVGLLAVGRLFPTGARTQAQDHLLVSANYYAQERLEMLGSQTWSDSTLADGRHPSATTADTLGSGRWTRYYTVTTMSGSLNNLKKVVVTVDYRGAGYTTPRSVTATTYVRR